MNPQQKISIFKRMHSTFPVTQMGFLATGSAHASLSTFLFFFLKKTQTINNCFGQNPKNFCERNIFNKSFCFDNKALNCYGDYCIKVIIFWVVGMKPR